MRKWILAAFLALAGCGTIAGLGQDISGSAETVGGWLGG